MVEGVTLVGLLPPELQNYLAFAGAVAADSASPGPALAFLRFLSDAARQNHWEVAGFEPAG
jgi:threonine/homoserine/homoserine lactone efflux protein